MHNLFFLQQEALSRNEEELAIQYGDQLLAGKTDTYFQYEILKNQGDAYLKLYKKNKVPDFCDKSEQFYLQAIEENHLRNEAKDGLVHLYIEQEKYEKALERTFELSEDPHPSIKVVANEKYHGYKYALQTKIYFSLLHKIEKALEVHLKSVDFGYIPNLVIENDIQLKKYLAEKGIGIIYADLEFTEQALWFKTCLLERDLFKEIIISNNPLCVAYAQKYYLHFTSDEKTCYLEECPVNVIKFLFTKGVENDMLNFYNSFEIPLKKEGVSVLLNEMFAAFDVNIFESIEDFIIHSKYSISPIQIAFFCDDYVKLKKHVDDVVADPELLKKVNFIITDKGELAAIVGATNKIVEFAAEDSLLFQFDIIQPPNLISLSSEVLPVNGISFQVKELKSNKKKIVIYAGGFEEWDGRTPFKTGMGASETSVIYIADEIVKLGYDVIVYSTIESPAVISGVKYLPMTNFDSTLPENIDLLISSRVPWLFKHRRFSNKQVVWVHDLPELWKDVDNTFLIDKFISVSKWAKRRFHYAHPTIPETKVLAIPNAINKTKRDNSIERISGRMAWISSPDRGLMDLIKCWKLADPQNIKIKELFVFYSYANLGFMSKSNPALAKEIFQSKYLLRQAGAKLTGRVPIQKLKRFLQSVDMLPYTSSFLETYCVSVVEILHAGVHAILNNNGSTLETAISVSEKGALNDLITVPTNTRKFSDEHIPHWIKVMMSDYEFNDRSNSPISDEHTWKNIVKQYWVPLIEEAL